MTTTAKEVKQKRMAEKKKKGKLKHSTKAYSRCSICGRARGYMRHFKMCRICFRERAHKGEVPGVKKSSW